MEKEFEFIRQVGKERRAGETQTSVSGHTGLQNAFKYYLRKVKLSWQVSAKNNNRNCCV